MKCYWAICDIECEKYFSIAVTSEPETWLRHRCDRSRAESRRLETYASSIKTAGTFAVFRTLNAASRCGWVRIVVVAPGSERRFQEEILAPRPLAQAVTLVPGGATRQESVYCGLKALAPDIRLVAIHDGARPCIDEATVRATFSGCDGVDGALVAIPVHDALKRVRDNLVVADVDREELLDVARGRALRPQPAARAGEVDAASRAERLAHAREARVREAEGRAALVGDDRRPQAVGSIGAERRREAVGQIECARVERHADLGVGATSLTAEVADQLSFEDLMGEAGEKPTAEERTAADHAVDEIRRRFGRTSIGPATLLDGSGLGAKIPGQGQWGPDEDPNPR